MLSLFLFEFCAFESTISMRKDFDELWGEYKVCVLSVYTHFLLPMVQNVAVVDVDDFALVANHNVVIVPVADSDHVGCH